MAASAGKKLRKSYAITRPREKWAAGEHDRFLHALLLFGRDWKRIEQFVSTKSATQVRSHAQKHFLKAHKLGLAAGLPPPHPRRAALFPRPSSYYDDGIAALATQWSSTAAPSPSTAEALPTGSSISYVDWACDSAGACWPTYGDLQGHGDPPIAPLISPGDGSFKGTPNCSEEPAAVSPTELCFADALFQDDTIQLPLSPDDLHFAQVYRFIGDVFGSGARLPVEAQLQRLQGMDPVVADTILLVLRNLEDNLFA